MEKKTAKQRPRKFRFTAAALAALRVPEGKAYIVVYDDKAPGFACRKSAAGKMTMFIQRKIKGRFVRKPLGEDGQDAKGAYVPGAKPSVEDFRNFALREVGQIAQSPSAWLEADEPKAADQMSVQEALDKALKDSRKGKGRGTLGTRDWTHKSRRFVAWLAKKYPHVRRWVEIERHHMLAYSDEMRARLAANSHRLLVQPIKQTGRRMARRFGLENPAAAIETSSTNAIETPSVHLGDVADLLDWLKTHHPRLEAGAALAGLAGLRMSEAVRLEWRHVDLEAGLIRVAVNEAKNPFSRRTLPLPARVLDALRRAYDARPIGKVESLDAKVILTPAGLPYYTDPAKADWLEYGRSLNLAIQEWKIGARWKAKDLRNCIAQEAIDNGWAGGALELYLGHGASGSITMRNYVGQLLKDAPEGDQKAFEKTMRNFRALIVSRIDAAVEEHYAERAAKAGKPTKAEAGR